MKKILFLAAVTILAAVSCNKIEEEGANTFEPSNVPSFVASVDGADTKTVIDGMKSYWNGKEEIWVLNGESNGDWKKKYVTEATKSEIATFNEENNEVSLSGDDYLAIYPAEPAGSVNWKGNIQSAATYFWLDPEQTIVEGSYDPQGHIAIAYAEADNENLYFKNVNSLVKFTVGSDNVTEVCFYGNNSEKIAGNFDVNYNGGNPTVTNVTETYAKVTGSFKKGKTYYISVLPCAFSKGFGVETYAYAAKGTKKNSKEYTLERNRILDLGELSWTPDEDATFYFELDTDNSKKWFSPGYLYVWTDGNNKQEPLGVWPGKQMTKSGNTYSVKIPKEYIGKKLNYIVNNGGDWKSAEGKSMNPVKASQTIKGSTVGIN